MNNLKAVGSQIQIDMVFTPVAPEIKEKVISAYLSGLGRNQIDRKLRKEGVVVSHGSISNIIARHNSPSSPGVDLAEPIDFADSPYHISDELLNDIYYIEEFDGESGERLLRYNVEPEQDVNARVDISGTQYDANVVTKTKIKETPKEPHQPRSSTSATEDSSLDLDWDTTNRFTSWVFEQKRRRNVERNMLSLHWNRLKEERQISENRRKEFEAAEADLARRIYQVKDLLPIADALKELGFDFSLANSWITCVSQMAQSKGLDLRSAAWKLAEDLKSWQELGSFETAIRNAKQQLSLLNVVLEDQKAAIAAIVDLRKSGMTEDEIADLTRVVSTSSGKTQNNGPIFKLDTEIIMPPTESA